MARLLQTGLLVFVSGLLAACSSLSNVTAVATQAPDVTETKGIETFTDPFSYCAEVGTIDSPDSRYTGPKITDEIVKGYLKAAGLDENSEYFEHFKESTIWRCMDSKVTTCNFGANLPCASKANTDKTPTQAMTDYCKENPDSDFIPMSVTGHEIIYSFHCVDDKPELLDQIAEVDDAGFLSNIWYAIESNP